MTKNHMFSTGCREFLATKISPASTSMHIRRPRCRGRAAAGPRHAKRANRANRADYTGATLLLTAAGAGDKEKVISLLERGADVDAADFYRWTPLIAAATQENAEILSVLLEYGANRELADELGRTPLVVAEQNRHQRVVELLWK